MSIILKKAKKTFPAILVVGPRQSGKTTLLKNEFGNGANFISLEEPDKRLWAKEDPRGFLENYSSPVIIDEFQYVPELLPYIKEKIDNNRKPGSYFLTGSQQFKVMRNVSESLAGRVAVTSLLPFSHSEIKSNLYKNWDEWYKKLFSDKGEKTGNTPGEIMMRGSYPELIANPKVDTNLWFSSYIQTYLERDVKSIYDIGNLDLFNKFISLLAARCSSVLNYSTFASDLGITIPTVKKWFSVLEASFIVFKLPPYYKNIGKRITKSPKYYFVDTGLAVHLSGINSSDYLIHGSMAGQFFENMIVSEFYKNRFNHNENLNMFFINHRNLWKIDLMLEKNLEIMPVEIKLSATLNDSHFKNFHKVREAIENISQYNYLICNFNENIKFKNSRVTSWRYL